MEMENVEEKLSCDLWFLLTAVWNGYEKFMCVKIHALKKASIAKL